MSKWDYAQIIVKWSRNPEGEDSIRDAYLCYLTINGSTIEKPDQQEETVKGTFGKPRTVKKPVNYLEWLNLKIAELGKNDWEMISAPSTKITGDGNRNSGGFSWTDMWVFWFKRPSN